MNTKVTATKPAVQESPVKPVEAEEKMAKLLAEMEQVKDRLLEKEKSLDEREAKMKAREEQYLSAPVTKPMTPEEKLAVEQSHRSKAQIMADYFKICPKRSIIIPRSPGESKNSVWEKSFNGYTVRIQKGVYVEVPEPVAENIMQEFNQEDEAGANFRLDRNPDKLDKLS